MRVGPMQEPRRLDAIGAWREVRHAAARWSVAGGALSVAARSWAIHAGRLPRSFGDYPPAIRCGRYSFIVSRDPALPQQFR